MKTHRLDTWPTYWDAVASGAKTFEVRLNDRDFQVGDRLVLFRMTEDRSKAPYDNVEPLQRIVTYVMPGGKFGVDDAFCVMATKEDIPF